MTKLRYILPAEWEEQSGILLSWPHADSDWGYMLDEVIDCYVNIATAITQTQHLLIVAPDISIVKEQLSELPQQMITYHQVETNDTWARDFGAITALDTATNRYVTNDFMFNGWGLKFASNHDNLITRSLYNAKLFNADYINNLNFILEGGGIESDGKGTILTTSECLLSPNRNGASSKQEIEQKLKAEFGAKQILWLNHGALEGDDTDSHIDTLARLAPNDTILYVGTDNSDDSHFSQLKAMERELQQMQTLDNKSYNLLRLPHPEAIFDEIGERLPATYANFLIMNSSVLVPTYNQPNNDKQAMEIIQQAFPQRKIIGIDCNALIKQHGSLHCVTMQFPKTVLNL